MIHPKRLRLLSFLLFLLLGPASAWATHLVGGNAGYQYQGADPNNPNNSLYLVYFQAYQDCNSPSWGTAFPEDQIEVGVYVGGISQSTLTFFDALTLNLTDSNQVEPNLPPNCSFNTATCIYLTQYSGTISLPNSSSGYHIFYDRCCRPGGIVNLQNSGNQGMVFTVHIPANNGTIIQNSTPLYTDTLLNFICQGDTQSISNFAIDPDGDSLVFDIVTPYDGVTSSGNPVPNWGVGPFASYFNPPNNISWATGYNLNSLFGATGYTNINSQTGITFFASNTLGNFVAAVEISEYRNGVLINRSRRDMQILVVTCPSNPTPNQDTSNLSPSAVDPTTYIIEEGESICFDINYFDPNGDTISLAATGSIFNSSVVNPAATINSPLTADSAITTQFCWNTTCNQGQTLPYSFNVEVTDNGCPPKTTVETYSVFVNNFNGPSLINGVDAICSSTGTTETYSVTLDTTATYNWLVTGGVLVNGQGTNQIVVDWGNGPTGEVSVTTTSQHGCVRGPLTLPVSIAPVIADAGPDFTICGDDSVQIGGSPTSTDTNNNVVWSPGIYLSDSTVNNPWASPDTTTEFVVYVSDTSGCVGTDTTTVTVFPTPDIGVEPSYFVCPGDTLQISTVNALNIAWSPDTGISDTTAVAPFFYPDTTTMYYITYDDTNGCSFTDSTLVIREKDVPTDAGEDQVICIGDTVMLGGAPTSTPFSTYHWDPAAGLIDDTLANPMASPSISTAYILQTANDTCTGRDTVVVIVNPLPTVTIVTDTFVCETDTIMLEASGAITYLWSDLTWLSEDSIANPLAFPDTSITLGVLGVNEYGCTDSAIVNLMVQPLPPGNAGNDRIECPNTPIVLGGVPTSDVDYLWSSSTNLNDDTLANPTAVLQTSEGFEMVVTDSLGCSTVDSLYIDVFEAVANNDTAVCIGTEISLESTINFARGSVSYLWNPSTLVADSTASSTTAIIEENTTFTLIAMDSLGCIDTAVFSVEGLPQLEATFDVEYTMSCGGVEAHLTSNTQNSTYLGWYINGYFMDSGEELNALLPYENNNTISLAGQNRYNCNDTSTITVAFNSLEEEVKESIPNIFTPNLDGINDYFEVLPGSNLSDCSTLLIYNRWGTKVFSSMGNKYPIWDGNLEDGQAAGEGVYYYIWRVHNVEFKGNVQLAR